MFGIGPARWPGSPSPSGVAHGFGLIPVDSAGEAAGVVSEVAGEEKIGGIGVEGTFNKDMTNDGTTFEAHKQIVKPWSQMCAHIWRASVRGEKNCACVHTVKCSLYMFATQLEAPALHHVRSCPSVLYSN